MIRKIISGIWTFLKRKLAARPLGRQLLAEAVKFRPSPDKMRALIAAGASLEMRDDCGRTPLLLAADTPWAGETVKILLDAGANVRARDCFGECVLCATDGNLDLMRLLLDRGAPSNDGVFLIAASSTRSGRRKAAAALLQCLPFGEGVEMLRRYGLKDPDGLALMAENVARRGEAVILRQCFAAGLDAGRLFQDHQDLAYDALRFATLDVVRVLVENGMPVDSICADEASLLCTAVRRGHMDIVRYLVERGADVYLGISDTCITPMWIAADRGYSDIVRFLFKAGPDPDRNREELKAALRILPPEKSAALSFELAAEGFKEGIPAAMETPAPLRVKKRPAPLRPV